MLVARRGIRVLQLRHVVVLREVQVCEWLWVWVWVCGSVWVYVGCVWGWLQGRAEMQIRS